MPKVNITKVIHADRNKVFNTVTDFQSLPKKLPSVFKSISVEKKDANRIVTKELTKMAGKEVEQTVQHTIIPPEKHEVEIIEGDAKGSKIVETYESIPEGTKVIIDGEFKLSGKLKLVEFLAKGRIEKGINEVLDELTKIV